MTVDEVRKRFLDFYAAHSHAVIPPAPLVPENDPTTLFTSSGMQPLVPYLSGQAHPSGKRLADSQPSFRAEDIEEVGDNRHTTFFEMLGNWSLGDYFKEEQLSWLFTFLTDPSHGLGLDPRRLYVTVFAGDEESGMPPDTEAAAIWERLFKEKGISAGFAALGTEAEAAERGMKEGERIFAYGAKKNWWSRSGTPSKMPVGEIGGPDSEVFYDFGTAHDSAFGAYCHPNCDCGRFIEIGNSVFMQFIKREGGGFAELPRKNVDFGGGLERLSAASREHPDIFLTDVFDSARAVLEKHSRMRYGADAAATRSFRIILDHLRATLFMLGSGITPANTEQGYIVRRLIRRALVEADSIPLSVEALTETLRAFGEAYAHAYPSVGGSLASVCAEFEKEEAQFRKTLSQGLRELEKMGTAIDPFVLYTTYGFPLELTKEIAAKKHIPLALEEVQERIRAHQEQSRAGASQRFAGGLKDHEAQTIRYHTAHHLLLRALQLVLGPSVHQRGSNITSERLRMDFSFDRKMTDAEKKDVERIVNEKIAEALPVIRSVLPKEEAEQLHAEHEFGARYPEKVSVYSIGPNGATEKEPHFSEAFSIEFCGGPHVANTAELGEGGAVFRIFKEEASSAGVRRIKAILAPRP